MEKIEFSGNYSQLIIQEQLGQDVYMVKLADGIDPNLIIPELYRYFQNIYQNDPRSVIFDLANILFPNGSFIAMLIAATAEARRRKSDLRLINLSETARNHFSIFTPLTYLNFGVDMDVSVEDIQEASPASYLELLEFEEGKPISLKLPATLDSLNRLTDFVTALAQKIAMEKIELSKLKIAVYECCVNVVEHGYGFEPGHDMAVEVLLSDSQFFVTIIDWGEPFEFYKDRTYDVESAFEEKQRGGFGMYIIERSVDEIKYSSDPAKGNRLTLVKKL